MTEQIQLGALLSRLIDYRGKTPPKADIGIKLITAKVIKDGGFDERRLEYVSEETYKRWMRRGLPKRGDILITTEAPLGEVAQLRTDEPVALAQRVILVRADPAKVDRQYLFHWLRSPLARIRLYERASGTTVSGIRQPELRAVRVDLPPRAAQVRIGVILDSLDDLIENNRRRIVLLEEMMQTTYQQWFVHFRFPGHEEDNKVDSEFGPIPKTWTVTSLDRVCELVKTKFDETRHCGLPLLDMARMQRGTLSVGELGSAGELTTSRIVFAEDDILFGSIRPYLHKVALAPCSGVTNTSVLVLRAINAQAASLLPVVCSSRETIAWATQQAVGTKMPVIKWDVLRSLQLVLPDGPTLGHFDALARPALEFIKVSSLLNRRLRMIRDLLLPRLMTGVIDVTKLDLDGLLEESGA